MPKTGNGVRMALTPGEIRSETPASSVILGMGTAYGSMGTIAPISTSQRPLRATQGTIARVIAFGTMRAAKMADIAPDEPTPKGQ